MNAAHLLQIRHESLYIILKVVLFRVNAFYLASTCHLLKDALVLVGLFEAHSTLPDPPSSPLICSRVQQPRTSSAPLDSPFEVLWKLLEFDDTDSRESF